MPDPVFLAVDLGAESGRVIAGRFTPPTSEASGEGGTVALEEVHRFPNGPVAIPGPDGALSLRWDLPALWKEIVIGLTKAGTRYSGEVVSIGVDTWGVDYVLLSETGEALGLPWNYRDARTENAFDEAFADVPREEIFAGTGIQFLPFNSLYQLRATRRDHPELLAAATRLVLMPDWFHRCLCGSEAVEFTNATTTQLVDPKTRDWNRDLIAKLDLPDRIFGPIAAPGTELGTLFPSLSQQTGLPESVKIVAPATHDTGSAVAAAPTERTGHADWAYISSGTWSLVGIETQGPVLGEQALAANVTNEGGVDGTNRLLKNVMGLWLVQGVRRSFARGGDDLDYAELTRRAAAAEGLVSLIDPDDPRFLAPTDMAAEIVGYCRETGQPEPEDIAAMVRCCLDSLALRYAAVLETLADLTGERPQVVHVMGGGCRNGLLNQLTANACGVPVLAGPVEATALGNVLMQMRAAFEIDSLAELRAVVRRSEEVTRFEPNADDDWAAAKTRLRKLSDRA
ncbi:rhamnulokinase [Alienimonas chondri]|uniref:L-Rhamnulokinase n=1 Tax=Alienimonas chondri TaxID=2681879 RepID=A0ABX1VAX1_9PLAN|nr:rhamnulokinase family protein [Alienimonas chondri]NNJ25242.1 L-Rhamnulokinase [Alienimonas chondri]